MAAFRWDPFTELTSLQERLEKMFRDIDRPRIEQNFTTSQWTPLVDIFEAGDLFVIKLEVPEVEKESIDVRMESNELIVTGERKLEEGTNKEQYLRMERGYGTFTRSFSLTQAI